MERVCRPCMSAAEKAEVWRRWKRGESVSDIGRALGRFRKSVHRVVAAHSCALGFSWTLDCERVLAGGVSR